ncbi:hypothetical protein AB0J86_02595 [Micromonospora sp. NPDC049559]|uniref:hypothetical protein n=1 Tax=Micromonospora sp. NPDC049559 TaxID=3155923 RepID=UPI00342302C7
MDGHELTEVVGAVGIFTLLTTVIAVTIVQIARTWRAKALLAREQAYQQLAENAANGQQETARQLAELGDRLVSMEARMAKLERVLQEVE